VKSADLGIGECPSPIYVKLTKELRRIHDLRQNRRGSSEEDEVSTRMEKGLLTTLLWVIVRLWSQWSE
jgi:hypothetical protein